MDFNDLNLEDLRLPQNYTDLIGVKKVLLTVPLRKPHKQEFVRTHPEWEFAASVLKLQGDRRDDLYVVSAHLLPILADDVTPTMFFATVSRQDTFTLWPVRLPGPDGRQDDWSRSSLEAAVLARTRWVKVVAKRALNAYEVSEPCGTFSEPVWPDSKWPDILRIAFRDHVIEDIEHPILRQLRGEV